MRGHAGDDAAGRRAPGRRRDGLLSARRRARRRRPRRRRRGVAGGAGARRAGGDEGGRLQVDDPHEHEPGGEREPDPHDDPARCHVLRGITRNRSRWPRRSAARRRPSPGRLDRLDPAGSAGGEATGAGSRADLRDSGHVEVWGGDVRDVPFDGEAPPPSQEAGPGGDASRPVSRVLSPPPVRPPRGPPPAVGDGHPSGAPVARRLERPHPGSGTSSPWSAGALRPCSALLRAGFTWPAGRPAAGGLLPHHFTVAAARLRAPWLCPFCGTLLRVTPTGRYPAPCSAEPGLSSSGRAARGRPASLRGESTPLEARQFLRSHNHPYICSR